MKMEIFKHLITSSKNVVKSLKTLNYCSKCGAPLNLKTKILEAFKNDIKFLFLITGGLVWLLLLVGTILSLTSPEHFASLLNRLNFIGGFVLNSLSGYGYDPYLKAKAMEITNSPDYLTNLLSLENYVCNEIDYSLDTFPEVVQTPRQTLERGYGDCEDKAILYCGLARQLNMACSIKCENNHCFNIVWILNNGKWEKWKVDPTACEEEAIG